MTARVDPAYVPALALTVLRDALLAQGTEDVRRETAKLLDTVVAANARADAAQRQTTAANREAASAHAQASLATLTERQRIVDLLRTEARTAARSWAGAYRHIADQLETASAVCHG